jgi:hypothetical protein
MDKTGSKQDIKERNAILYGVQRSGTNYAQQVMLKNFRDIHFPKQQSSRCLPTHKHFRLYDEKSMIPDIRYSNAFTYRSFTDFKKHLEKVAGKEFNTFIICIKDPCSWYLSYKKHARKNKYPYFKRSLNSHYLIDYNLFYRKWYDFSMEAPDEVLLLKYEDLIEDLDGSLQRIGKKFKLEKSSDVLVNPGKVPMNRTFTKAKSVYYKEKKYLDLISDRDKGVIQHLLDPEVLSAMNYQIIK